jgi:hypothetical protein
VVREARKWKMVYDGMTHHRRGRRSSNAGIWMVCCGAGALVGVAVFQR